MSPLKGAAFLSALSKLATQLATLRPKNKGPQELKDNEANWLPAPNGPIYMVMRLYWPKTEPPSILPPGAGTWSPPPVVKVL